MRWALGLLAALPAPAVLAIDDERIAQAFAEQARYLADEALSYQEVLDDTRANLARHYLSRSTISPGEISFLIGFQDANSFLRAFKSWTGMTPGEYRNQHCH